MLNMFSLWVLAMLQDCYWFFITRRQIRVLADIKVCNRRTSFDFKDQNPSLLIFLMLIILQQLLSKPHPNFRIFK